MTADLIERRHQALMELAEFAKWMARRDELVRNAAAAGIPKADIAAIIRTRRSTVYEILARQEAGK